MAVSPAIPCASWRHSLPLQSQCSLKAKPNKLGLISAHNFDPVDELPPTPCRIVKGRIPSVLRSGAYIRNGPNPQYPSPENNHHLFEGDGMLHSLLFPADDNDNPIFCSRFVQTSRFQQEKKAGKRVIGSFFSDICGSKPLSHIVRIFTDIVTRKIDISGGVGEANAGLAFFGGKLLAMDEADLPYVVRLSSSGELTTRGRCDFQGRLSTCMTAHPKKDPITGEVFAMRNSLRPPFLTYFRFNAEGVKQRDVPMLSLKRLFYVHDFAISERYAVFCDNACSIRPLEKFFFGAPITKTDGRVLPRIGVIPRYSECEKDIQWFDAPGFTPLHVLNAWDEENGSVVNLVACNVSPFDKILDGIELVKTHAHKVKIDLKEKTVSRALVCSKELEFGEINPRYVGRRTRYAYYGVHGVMSNVCGLLKLDLESKSEGDVILASRMYGERRFGGEAVFVPAPDEGGEEDDGYLLTFVHDEGTGESSFIVMDARSPDLEVVAEVALPRRVPYGFHGIFISKDELQVQEDHKP